MALLGCEHLRNKNQAGLFLLSELPEPWPEVPAHPTHTPASCLLSAPPGQDILLSLQTPRHLTDETLQTVSMN